MVGSQNPVGDMPRGPRPLGAPPSFRISPRDIVSTVLPKAFSARPEARTQRLGIWLNKGISALVTWILLSWLLKHHFFSLVEPACLFLNHAKSIFVLVKCWFNNYSIPHCLLVTYHMANSLIFYWSNPFLQHYPIFCWWHHKTIGWIKSAFPRMVLSSCLLTPFFSGWSNP